MTRSHVWIVEVDSGDGWTPYGVTFLYTKRDAEAFRREAVYMWRDRDFRFRVRKYVREEQ